MGSRVDYALFTPNVACAVVSDCLFLTERFDLVTPAIGSLLFIFFSHFTRT